MNILAFDTASSSGAVAIMKDGAIIAHTQLNIGLTHSEQLLPAVDDLVQHAAGNGQNRQQNTGGFEHNGHRKVQAVQQRIHTQNRDEDGAV